MEFISERVSLEHRPDGVSVVITARLPRVQEALLVTWFAAWCVIGGFYGYETFHLPAGDKRSFYLLFMLGWAWIAFRIGRVVLWRLKGFELLRIKAGVFTIKNSILGYGRARDHFVENIKQFGLVEVDEASWRWQLNDSFWVMGAERLGFTHVEKKVIFGKGLDKEEAQRIAVVLERALKQARKAVAQ